MSLQIDTTATTATATATTHFLSQHRQPHRLPSACDRHPAELVTGFCASCLRERLAGLETSNRCNATSTSSSAFKSLFLKNLDPTLRRCKSFSIGRGDGLSASLEPQRKSCDVRGRSTLWSLFNQDDRLRDTGRDAVEGGEIEIERETETESHHLGLPSSGIAAPVLEAREEGEEEDFEIGPADPDLDLVVETRREISREEVGEGDAHPEVKPMKEHIDLESQAKKPPAKDLKEVAGSFWMAASVFSKKLQKWRGKQKLKKQGSTKDWHGVPADKHSSARMSRDAQSEFATDAFGRRSCDTDPRFSVDIGRLSVDYSWDEPRASWDGYLIGSRSALPRFPPPMLSVIEDHHPGPAVQRTDGQIPVEEDSSIPGGSAQTRDYYLDSSSQRRRRSLDRSNSIRRSFSVEMGEPRLLASNAKVSPAVAAELYHGNVGINLERDSRDLMSSSLREDRLESFASANRDSCKAADAKKPKKWSKKWSIWGFLHRRSGSKGGEDNVVGRSFSESWPEFRRESSDARILRCSSNVSSRHSFSGRTGFGSARRSFVETNGHGRRRVGEPVLERNRSARYSASNGNVGMPRFSLTPMQGSWKNGGENSKNSTCQLYARSMLQLY